MDALAQLTNQAALKPRQDSLWLSALPPLPVLRERSIERAFLASEGFGVPCLDCSCGESQAACAQRKQSNHDSSQESIPWICDFPLQTGVHFAHCYLILGD